MVSQLKILVCDDDKIVHKTLGDLLAEVSECRVTHVFSPEEARTVFDKEQYDLIFVDLFYESCQEDGFAILDYFRKKEADTFLVVNSSSREFEDVLKALRLGANDYFPKGVSRGEMKVFLQKILAQRKWWSFEKRSARVEKSAIESNGVARIMGNSEKVQALKSQISRYGRSVENVLILGKTGSGKELVARALHEEVGDRSAPFVAVDCGAVPVSTADDFFFGHERGAFTGAETAAEGVFELAHEGTLFLDEVNSLALDMQNKLLRVLQEREVRRLGSKKNRSVSFRLLVATNQPLEGLVAKGLFREDLFFRLQVLRITVPGLQERSGDIGFLAGKFLPNRRLSEELLNVMDQYSWPGNVRELRNFLVALDINSPENEELTSAHIPEFMREKILAQTVAEPGIAAAAVNLNYEEFKKTQIEREREFFRKSYHHSSGNISLLARKLGLDRSYLFEKLVSYQIHESKKDKNSKR